MQRMTVGVGIGLILGLAIAQVMRPPVAHAEAEKAEADRVFELRTYVAPPGKLADLNTRFRDHTTKLFEKHGMKNVIYLTPTDPEKSKNTLIYLISHASQEAAQKNWAAFRADPEWQAAHKASEQNGKLVEKATFDFYVPTDYSPIKH